MNIELLARRGVLAGAVALAACAGTMRSGGYYEPAADLTAYSSFTWDEPDTRPAGDPRLENNPFLDRRIRAAIEWELAVRGITAGGSGRALLVHYHANVTNRVDVYEADRTAGYTSSEYGEGTQVIQYEEGTLLVDIADAETKELLWRGWAQRDVTRALDDVDLMRRQVDEAITAMFRAFPVPRRGGTVAGG